MKEKFKVKLTEYMIRRIMLELSLRPEGINRRILGIYLRIGAFYFVLTLPFGSSNIFIYAGGIERK